MKNLIHVNGNLLNIGGVDVIGHQANCQNTFGSGIARSIREVLPEAYEADTKADQREENYLGNISIGVIPPERHPNIRAVFNLYGQNLGTDHSKKLNRKTDYEALFSALERMRDFLDENEMVVNVGFPMLMGSALGGGSWDIVSRLIEVAFDGYRGNVFIVKFVP